MTARNAVVLIAGQLQELPAGDTLNGASGGGVTIRQVVLDFGQSGLRSKTFSFNDALAFTTSNIFMFVGLPADGRWFDELEMDSFTCAAACLSTGIITVSAIANPGPVTGTYAFNYFIG